MRSYEARELGERALEGSGEGFGLSQARLGQLAIGGGHAHLVDPLIENVEFCNHQLLQ